jgi:hypothetical protein
MAKKTIVYVTFNKGEKNEITLKIGGYYSPSEPKVMYPTDNAYAGSSAEFDIQRIELISGSVTDLILEELTIDKLSEKCLYEMDADLLDSYSSRAYDDYNNYLE